ncbi:MAG: ABC transporter permease [Anaerolineales bacterium]|nr:ABC transporter permease [Anaerolineales bacterium]
MDIAKYTGQRLLLMIPMLIGVTLITFIVSNVVPVDPLAVILNPKMMGNEEIRQAAIEKWGLDKPLPVQYLNYLSNLVQGDMGTSFKTKRPVAQDLADYLPATVELAMTAFLYAVAVGLPLGVLAALYAGKWIDHVARLFSLLGASMPPFWSGLVFLYIFYYLLHILPGPGRLNPQIITPETRTGMLLVDSLIAQDWTAFFDTITHLILPAMILGWFSLALIARITRASLMEVLQMDYIRTARAKGLHSRQVIVTHAIRNALIPTITIMGLEVAWLLTGSIMTEIIFAWPGIGRYAVESARNLDYPAVMGTTLLVAVIYMLCSLVVDIAYGVVDPRIREG